MPFSRRPVVQCDPGRDELGRKFAGGSSARKGAERHLAARSRDRVPFGSRNPDSSGGALCAKRLRSGRLCIREGENRAGLLFRETYSASSSTQRPIGRAPGSRSISHSPRAERRTSPRSHSRQKRQPAASATLGEPSVDPWSRIITSLTSPPTAPATSAESVCASSASLSFVSMMTVSIAVPIASQRRLLQAQVRTGWRMNARLPGDVLNICSCFVLFSALGK